MNLKIETGIPLPKSNKLKKNKRLNSFEKVARINFIHTLQVGDSFVCENETARNSYFTAVRRKGLIKLTAKKNIQTGEFRIWRIE